MKCFVSLIALLSLPLGFWLTYHIALSTPLAIVLFPILHQPIAEPTTAQRIEIAAVMFAFGYAPALLFLSWVTIGARTLYHVGVQSFALQVLGGIFFPVSFPFALKRDPPLALSSLQEVVVDYFGWNDSWRGLRPATSVLLCALTLILAAPISAQQSAIQFGLRPDDATKGYFEFNAKPGEVIKDAVLVVNDSEQPLTLNVTLADGQTNATGGTGFADKADKAKYLCKNNFRTLTTDLRHNRQQFVSKWCSSNWGKSYVVSDLNFS